MLCYLMYIHYGYVAAPVTLQMQILKYNATKVINEDVLL